ncbi:acyl-CoA dehydrogenase family protein [Natronosporangium hydrolyticum]|uniref:Acyl-CoA dehydrogenase family protein n=1 Tax=Natronosporangium hydrolyticum TaxID=2811111 RepID=A0A895YE45_9ACTN|nr:acyl-CoA dehydrogenase family protein [Natronosporangium hydrolyticum]QSB13713.1 acyl-CoA dehydrogenase family protein [Natronosporangium hydrolyticum]
MEFGHDEQTRELLATLQAFMDEHIYPAEPILADELAANPESWDAPPIIARLQTQARDLGLWNLFLPHEAGGALTNVQYAPIAELTGHSPSLAPAALNCAAPDTGNIELLARYGTPEQRRRWLEPLLAGTIRSAFCMTEPQVASSDATNVATRITRDGDEWVITGEKWFATGAMSSQCAFFIVMGKTDPAADRHRQQSMVLVPRDTPGVTIRRGLSVLGFADRSHGGHAEISFQAARVPADHVIGGVGEGFAIAQARLGPGRIHHCMRQLGAAERALALLCARAVDRVSFGRPLADQGMVQDWIAEARVTIEQLRLLVLRAAWVIDQHGNRAAHRDVQAIKIAVPRAVEWIIDKAIQTYGAAGLSQDTPLGMLWANARSLRLADGPDEVHKASLARQELRRYRASGRS